MARQSVRGGRALVMRPLIEEWRRGSASRCGMLWSGITPSWVFLPKASRSSSSISSASRTLSQMLKPWSSSQPIRRNTSACPFASTPSATTRISSEWARPTTARATRSAAGSESTSRTIERSILSTSSGKRAT